MKSPRAAVFIRSRRGRVRRVEVAADDVREQPDRRGRVAFLRDGETVAKFHAKDLAGWMFADG